MPDNANQQMFVVHKQELEIPYLQVNKELWKDVHKELGTGAAFSLWLWYSSNADGFKDDIYPATIIKELGIGKQTYYNARDKLITYGYLIPDKNKTYLYHFYEKSPVSSVYIKKIKKDPMKETELQNEYKQLMQSHKQIEDMSLNEWWLFWRGQYYNWQKEWSF